MLHVDHKRSVLAPIRQSPHADKGGFFLLFDQILKCHQHSGQFEEPTYCSQAIGDQAAIGESRWDMRHDIVSEFDSVDREPHAALKIDVASPWRCKCVDFVNGKASIFQPLGNASTTFSAISLNCR